MPRGRIVRLSVTLFQTMFSRRYTVVVADRTSGVIRRFTISLRPTLAAVTIAFSLPVLIGLGARWSVKAELEHLRASNSTLREENISFRAATGELTTQISALQSAIVDLGAQAQLDPAAAKAVAKLPALVRSQGMAVGGARGADAQRAADRGGDSFAGRYVRGVEGSARESRAPVERGARGCDASHGAGQRDAVDLADAGVAHLGASGGGRIRLQAGRTFTRGWTSPPIAAIRSMPPPMAWCRALVGVVITATWSSSPTNQG